jgi:hypothetical protein
VKLDDLLNRVSRVLATATPQNDRLAELDPTLSRQHGGGRQLDNCGGHNAVHTSDDLVEEDDRRRQLKVARPFTSFDCLCYGGYFGTPQRQSLEALGSLDRAA